MIYINEVDAGAADWLRQLMASGLIPYGHVDERPIQEIQPSDLEGYIQCHFFAGIGGWPLALQLAGWPATRPVWTGSCPCQPFSAAGKLLGNDDERDLWPVFFQLIKQCRPVQVFGEQVERAIRFGWLDRVQADMEGESYAIGAAVLGAHSVGAPHIRQRLYWVADAAGIGRRQERAHGSGSTVRDSTKGAPPGSRPGRSGGRTGDDKWINCADGSSRRIEPGLSPLAYGIPARVVRLRGYGNAIVPQVAAEFIAAYSEAQEPHQP